MAQVRCGKTSGAANTKGQMYEIKMAALVYIRAMNKGYRFSLGTNVAGLGKFDDLVLKYKEGINDEGSYKTCLIQLKNRRNIIINSNKLLGPPGPISLESYYDSFCKIKETMCEDDKSNEFLKGSFENCSFGIFTSAKLDEKMAEREKYTGNNDLSCLLKTKFKDEHILSLFPKSDQDVFHDLIESGDPDIKDFLQNLLLFTGEPNEKTLDKIIIPEIQKKFNLSFNSAEVCFKYVLEEFTKWYNDRQYILNEESSILINAYNLYRVVLLTQQKEERYSRINYTFQKTCKLDIPLNSSSAINIISAYPKDVTISCIKLFQFLRKQESYIFLNMETLLREKDPVMSVWKSEKKNTMVIVNKSNHNDKNLINDICNELKTNSKKRCVVLSLEENEFSKSLKRELDNKFEQITDNALSNVDDADSKHFFSDIDRIFDNLPDDEHKKEFINMTNSKAKNALHLACESEDWEKVSSLLNRGINITAPDVSRETPLHIASKNGYLKIVQLLVEKCEDEKVVEYIHTLDAMGFSALHRASENGHRTIVNYLLLKGSGIEESNNSKDTLLNLASFNGHFSVVKLLLDRFKKNRVKCIEYMDFENSEGMGAIHCASQNGHKEVVELLLNRGCNVLRVNVSKKTPLHLASEFGHVDIVELLLNTFKDEQERLEYINMRDADGCTSLLLSSFKANWVITQQLINWGGDVTICNNNKTTSLHVASSRGDFTLLNILMKCFHDNAPQAVDFINMTDCNRSTAIHIASSKKDWQIVQVLINNGGDVTIMNTRNETSLHIAAKIGSLYVVRLLVESVTDIGRKKSFINMIDCYGQSALRIACENNHSNVVSFLIQEGGDIMSLDSKKQTYLHIAAFTGNLCLVQVLINSFGPDKDEKVKYIDMLDDNDCSSMHLAYIYGHWEIFKFLISIGGRVQSVNKEQETLLHIASSSGHLIMVKLIIDSLRDGDRSKTIEYYLNMLDSKGNSAILNAYVAGYWEVVDFLIECGGDVTLCNDNGDTILHLCCSNGHLIMVDKLMNNFIDKDDSKHKFISMLDKNGDSAIDRAYKTSHWNVVELLIQNGGDVTTCGKDQKTLLHLAASQGHKQIVNVIIGSLKPDQNKIAELINRPDSDGHSSVYLTCLHGHWLTLEILIGEGGDVTVCNNVNETPLHFASRNGYINLIRVLIGSLQQDRDKRVDYINKKDKRGVSSVYSACLRGHIDVVEYLIDSLIGDSQSISLCSLESVLHLAANRGYISIVEFFTSKFQTNRVEFLRFINSCDENGDNAMILAYSQGHWKVAEHLIKLGGDVMAQNKKQESLLYLAAYNGDVTFTQTLIDSFEDNKNKLSKFLNCFNEKGENAITVASLKEHWDVVKLILDNGGDVMAYNTDGKHHTPLHFASSMGKLDLIKIILDSLRNDQKKIAEFINMPDRSGSSAMHLAAINSHWETVVHLIQNGGDMMLVNDSGLTPLHYASSEGYVYLVENMIKSWKGDKSKIIEYIYSPDNNDQNAIQRAIQGEHIQLIMLLIMLLVESGENIAHQDKTGDTLLHIATYKKQITLLKMLIEKFEDEFKQCINVRNNEGRTCLHLACSLENVSLVLLFIQNCGDVMLQDNQMNTPLHLASIKGNLSPVKLLVESLRNNESMMMTMINNLNSDDNNAVCLAAQNGHWMIVEYLIENGCDVFSVNKESETLLHIASNKGEILVVKMILEKVDVNNIGTSGEFLDRLNLKGHSAMHIASKRGHWDIVECLINKGGSVMTISSKQNTQLHFASKNGHHALVKILIRKLDINTRIQFVHMKNSAGKNAMHLAAQNLHKDIVEILINNGGNVMSVNRDLSTLVLYKYQQCIDHFL